MTSLFSVFGRLRQTINFLREHPLTRHAQVGALARLIRWQWYQHVVHRPLKIPFVNGSSLLLRAGFHGLTGFFYVGLPDFEECAFTLHLLRQGDFFGDVEANAGAWTVMTSAGVGAQVDAFEPIADAVTHLVENVALNRLESHVQIHAVGIGRQAGTLRFTSSLDTGNHVVIASEIADVQNETFVEVPVTTLDEVYKDRCPRVIKIDVEGWELEVIKGARSLLRNPCLTALVIETFRHHNLATPKLQEMEAILAKDGFRPYSYQPFQRRLEHVDKKSRVSDNTIYVRNFEEVQIRLGEAPAFTIMGKRI